MSLNITVNDIRYSTGSVSSGASFKDTFNYVKNYLEVKLASMTSYELVAFSGFEGWNQWCLFFRGGANNKKFYVGFAKDGMTFENIVSINITNNFEFFFKDFTDMNYSRTVLDNNKAISACSLISDTYYNYFVLRTNYYKFQQYISRGVKDPTISSELSSWQTAYLNDKKMHAISVGKTFQFTKIKNADGSPHTGGETETFSVDRGGLTATGFKKNPSEGLFLERSNELLPGTFVIGGLIFGSKAGNYLNGINKIINNSTDPLSGVSQGAQAYVRNINENMSNVTKIISQGNIWTGTILKAKTFMSAVGSGSPASMSLLGAMGFGTMMGLSVIAGIELGNVVVDKVKEYVTPQGTYKLDKYSNLFDIYQTSDYIDGLIQQAEANANAQNETSSTTHADNGTNSAEQIDEWEKEQAEAQAQADAQAKEKAEAEKAALELETETLKKDVLTVIKEKLTSLTNIIDVLHTEATQKYDGSLTRAQAKQQAYELEYSKQIEEHYTDTAGNTQSILKGSKANTKINTRKNIEQHVKDYSDNESYAELNNFNPSEYLHEEKEIVPNSTYEEVEYKIMALAMELISGTITKAEYETRLNELR